jgi:hypothetical protein
VSITFAGSALNALLFVYLFRTKLHPHCSPNTINSDTLCLWDKQKTIPEAISRPFALRCDVFVSAFCALHFFPNIHPPFFLHCPLIEEDLT